MLTTRILTNRKDIENMLPRCMELERISAIEKPFNYSTISLLWWDYFNSKGGIHFGKNRGRNYLGAQSWLNNLYLIVSAKNSELLGYLPLVSYSIKISGFKEHFNILSFPFDPPLIPYQDFIVFPSMRDEILSSIFTAMFNLLEKNYDILFLGNIPDESPNIPTIKKIINTYSNSRVQVLETKTTPRAGLWPWTIILLISALKNIQTKLDQYKITENDLRIIINELENFSKNIFFFPASRIALETKIIEILNKLKDIELIRDEIKKTKTFFSSTVLKYPYIILPSTREQFLMTLSKSTRRYFRRYKKQYEEQNGTFEKLDSKQITNKDIKDYLDLHSLKWGVHSSALNELTVIFHTKLCKILAEKGFLTLFFAKYRGKRIASHLCFDTPSRREGYYNGRDPQYDNLRAGRLLYLETIFDAIDNDFVVYDLGQGDADYKRNFTNLYGTTRNFVLNFTEKIQDINNIFIGYEYMS